MADAKNGYLYYLKSAAEFCGRNRHYPIWEQAGSFKYVFITGYDDRGLRANSSSHYWIIAGISRDKFGRFFRDANWNSMLLNLPEHISSRDPEDGHSLLAKWA